MRSACERRASASTARRTRRVREQRRDVLEDDARLRMVGDVANVLPQEFPAMGRYLPADATRLLSRPFYGDSLPALAAALLRAGAACAAVTVRCGRPRAGRGSPASTPCLPRAVVVVDADHRHAGRDGMPRPSWSGGGARASTRYCGSFSFHHASIGAATKIDEYEPMNRPTASASAKSSSAVAPMMQRTDDQQREHRQERDERRRERPHQHLVERPVHHLGVRRPPGGERSLVLPHLVEHDDGVVERETEDRQERGDGRGRDRNGTARRRRRVKMMSWITATIAAADIFHSNRNVR